MASAEQQNNVSMIQSQLNKALECQEKNKQLLRQLLKVKIFNDQTNLDSLIEKTKKKLSEDKLNKELQKQSELEKQKVGKEKTAVSNESAGINVKDSMKSLTNVPDDKRCDNKEATDTKPDFADETSKETGGHLESEFGGHHKNKNISTAEKETTSVSSKISKRTINGIPVGNNLIPPRQKDEEGSVKDSIESCEESTDNPRLQRSDESSSIPTLEAKDERVPMFHAAMSQVVIEKNNVEDKEKYACGGKSTNTAKTRILITTQGQDEAESITVHPSHVYAKVIILNEKKDGDSYKASRNVEVFNHVVKASANSGRSPQCQNGDHDDNFDEIVVTSSGCLMKKKDKTRKSKCKKEKVKRTKTEKEYKKKDKKSKFLKTKTTSTQFHQTLINIFCCCFAKKQEIAMKSR